MTDRETRLTAYALGELPDDERAALEAELAGDPEALGEVEAIRELGTLLRKELASEPAPALTDAQRAAIAERAADAPRAARAELVWALAATAGLLVAVSVWPANSRSRLKNSFQKGARRTDSMIVKEIGGPSATPAEDELRARLLAQAGTERAQRELAEKLQAAFAEPSRVPFTVATCPSSTPGDDSDRGDLWTGGATPVAPGTTGDRYFGTNHTGTIYYTADGRVVVEEGGDREGYARRYDNQFQRVADKPLSTFSIDVDTASYANVRRFLRGGQLPPAGAVRIEELINYFPYAYRAPSDGSPFAVNAEVAACPWNRSHRLVRLGLKGCEVARGARPVSNLVFLLDVSGSMQDPNKLPLLKRALTLMTRELGENDRVSIVVYAGASGLVLPPTAGDRRGEIEAALERLQAGGSTNGGAGIELAYRTAVSQFVQGGVNRVILATDGDFNVGTTSQDALTRLIEEMAHSGVFLTVLGFGMGNYQDATLEQLADKGNGNYAYVDTLREANKVLVEELAGTLVTVAKDVKIQIEFNPAQVAAYRLIGYENRVLADRDFNDDTKDAGEVGAGHTVTALYEVVPVGVGEGAAETDPLRYQQDRTPTPEALSGELLTLKLRHKRPDADVSVKDEFVVRDLGKTVSQAGDDFRFAASVAAFGMLLRGSPHAGDATWREVLELAQASLGADPGGYRAEFLELVRAAAELSGGR